MSTSKSQVWNTAGSFTFTFPTGVYVVRAYILGAGSGGDRDLAGNNIGGRGGGAGEQVSGVWLYGNPGDTLPVVVGAAGVAGFWNSHTIPTNGAVAQPGGNSSFGVYVALGGGRGETGGVAFSSAPFGGGVNGGLQTNSGTPVFAQTIALADGTLWYGGSGSGAGLTLSGTARDGTPGGPAGGRLAGGIGGTATGAGITSAGGGGGATNWGVGGRGGDTYQDGTGTTIPGAGGGGAGGTDHALGVGPFHDGGIGGAGLVSAHWIEP